MLWLGQASGHVVSFNKEGVMIVKSLVAARDILLQELQILSKAIDKTIDLTDFISEMDDVKLFDSIIKTNLRAADGEVSRQGKPQNGLEVLTYFMQHCTSGFGFQFLGNFFFCCCCVLNIYFSFLSRKQMACSAFKLMNCYTPCRQVLY